MATDKRGRKLPKGIQQRYEGYEGRFMYKGKRYLVHGKTITGNAKIYDRCLNISWIMDFTFQRKNYTDMKGMELG